MLLKSEKEINSLDSESDSKDNILIKLYDEKNNSEIDLSAVIRYDETKEECKKMRMVSVHTRSKTLNE